MLNVQTIHKLKPGDMICNESRCILVLDVEGIHLAGCQSYKVLYWGISGVVSKMREVKAAYWFTDYEISSAQLHLCDES